MVDSEKRGIHDGHRCTQSDVRYPISLVMMNSGFISKLL
jgi:hypothetical protein